MCYALNRIDIVSIKAIRKFRDSCSDLIVKRLQVRELCVDVTYELTLSN
jgi:hypothetical protein